MSELKVKIKYLRRATKRPVNGTLSANDFALLGDKAVATLIAGLEKIKDGEESAAEEAVITKWL